MVRVVAAVIGEGDRVFATQRGYGAFKDGWEFPGGKVEPYDYPDFHLSMGCYLCAVRSGSLTLKEHESARWLGAEELDQVAWLPADLSVIELLKGLLARRQ